MLTGFRWPILIGALLLTLFAWSACGGGDEKDDGGSSGDPVATKPATDVKPTQVGGDDEPTASVPTAGGGDASASVTLAGKTIEFTGGGGCTEISVSGGKGLSVSLEMFELGIGIIEGGQTPADSGEAITDAVFNLVVDAKPYASIGTTDEITVTVKPDLSGGEFTGTIDSPVTPGSKPETISGTFTCK
jgi:hypothetical protein